eukprot:jgi/Ulvmu1/4920/UM202_0005.1
MRLGGIVSALLLATACTAQQAHMARPERPTRRMREARLPPQERGVQPGRSMSHQRQPPASRPKRMPGRGTTPKAPIPPKVAPGSAAEPPFLLAPGPATPVDTPMAAPMPGPPNLSTVDPPAPNAAQPPMLSPGPLPQASPPAPGTLDAEEGDLRLAGRLDINGYATGALQVFHDGAFGAVCGNTFDEVDAEVACRQLGFSGGVHLPLAVDRRFPDSNRRETLKDVIASFVLENLNCTGSETRLVDCPVATDVSFYDPPTLDYMYEFVYADINNPSDLCNFADASFAFVACGNTAGPARGDLRLTRGVSSPDGNSEFGRLEIFNEGGWGAVCESVGGNGISRFPTNDAPFTQASAEVACKQLGFESGVMTGYPQLVVQETSPLRRIPFVLAGASCTGDEARLEDCPGAGLGASTQQCGLRSGPVAVTCFSNVDEGTEGQLRLMQGQSGPGYEYGRLEILRRGLWSTLCDEQGFTPDTALVACSILGFDGGAALDLRAAYRFRRESDVFATDLPVGLASVDCAGTETSLLQCESGPGLSNDCGVRGRELTDSTVLACANSAASCPPPPPPVEGSVRLRGGFGSICDPLYTGFVEVFHLEEWGAICTDSEYEDFLVADVVCRQLGFPHGTVVDPVSPIDYSDEAEEPQERFWLTNAQCRGVEEELLDCRLGQGFITNNQGCGGNPSRFTVACRAFAVSEALEDVSTPGAVEGDVRLVDPSTVANWQMGRLEVFFEGSWSQVCSLDFEEADANVACRQLGFGAGTAGPGQSESFNYANPVPDELIFPEVAIVGLGCTGTEANLLACPGEMQSSLPFGATSETCFYDNDPGLVLACVVEEEAGQEGALRLTSTGGGANATPGTGILEIFHAGAWGTVCEAKPESPMPLDYTYTDFIPTLPEISATVACQQLGFQAGGFRPILVGDANMAVLPPWLGRIPCDTLQDELLDCGLTFANTATCGATQELVCNNGEFERNAVRLVGGSADPGGSWAYGRLEVYNENFFAGFSEVRFRDSQQLGRSGVPVACRGLGFETGAQLLSGLGSGLPGEDVPEDTVNRIVCTGDEDALTDCAVTENDYGNISGENDGDNSVAIICYNPSGCTTNETEPQQGDVRLIQLSGINEATQPCDDVHFGGVEIFNDGQWGRICKSRGSETSIVNAKVICRHLGFPFSSLMGTEEVRTTPAVPVLPGPPRLVWAAQVLCTGKEERLDECFFPEDFGNIDMRLPDQQSPGDAGVVGVEGTTCSAVDNDIVGVICRRFEIEESDVIR